MVWGGRSIHSTALRAPKNVGCIIAEHADVVVRKEVGIKKPRAYEQPHPALQPVDFNPERSQCFDHEWHGLNVAAMPEEGMISEHKKIVGVVVFFREDVPKENAVYLLQPLLESQAKLAAFPA
jgi:hypothetical protein